MVCVPVMQRSAVITAQDGVLRVGKVCIIE